MVDVQDKIKKALVVGGSNGIGLALSLQLINLGYHVIIVDIKEPNKSNFKNFECDVTYIKINLLQKDLSVFDKLAQDLDISVLMITAGFGNVKTFEYVDITEIDKILNINTISIIKIIKYFYSRIHGESDFYSGVLCSIAGLISSPLFSVYSASKAALCKLIESVNVELEVEGASNRILNVSPGSIKGTSFNGGETKIDELSDLSQQILDNLFMRNQMFIPQYEEVYENVINRYKLSPHDFGVESYKYKLSANRVENKKITKIGYLSGTFDLFHIGHLNLLKSAKEKCDYLIVGVHKDTSYKRKMTFIPFDERTEIIKSCSYVDKVVESCKEDCDAWKLYNYDILFVGSDYKGTERFLQYEKFFMDKNVKIEYFPYTQGTSSTQMRELIQNKK